MTSELSQLLLSTSALETGDLDVGLATLLWCCVVVEWLVPVFTSGNILGVITRHSDIVEDKAGWATRVPWFLSVEADVEKLAIGRMGEGWVDLVETIDDLLGGVSVTAESVI